MWVKNKSHPFIIDFDPSGGSFYWSGARAEARYGCTWAVKQSKKEETYDAFQEPYDMFNGAPHRAALLQNHWDNTTDIFRAAQKHGVAVTDKYFGSNFELLANNALWYRAGVVQNNRSTSTLSSAYCRQNQVNRGSNWNEPKPNMLHFFVSKDTEFGNKTMIGKK